MEDSLVNLQLNGYQKSHRTLHMLLHYLAKEHTINDKLQGSVAAYLRCAGVGPRCMYVAWKYAHNLTMAVKVIKSKLLVLFF